MKIYDNIIDDIYRCFGFERRFSDNDDMYKELRLSEYGILSDDTLSDNNLKLIWHRDDLNIDIYNKFTAKYCWLEIVRNHNFLCVSITISIILFILSLMCYWLIIPFIVSIIPLYYIKRKLRIRKVSFKMLDYFSKLD
jgi:hypothetical protein